MATISKTSSQQIAASARKTALLVLLDVYQYDQKLDDALANRLPILNEHRERAFAQHLAYNVLRWQVALDAIYKQLVRKPLSAKDQDIELIIFIGLEQLWHSGTPAHAAINTSVELVKSRKKSWARALVNAVLRRFQREQESLLATLQTRPSDFLACPEWLLERWQNDWPNDWQSIAQACLADPPLWLRVNQRQNTTDEFQAVLNASEITAITTSSPSNPAALWLPEPRPVTQIPGFMDGAASVQDISAQLAAYILEPQPGNRVLDACSAPGGKTAHLLEQYPGIELTALDNKMVRLEKLHANLQRLKLTCNTRCADACDLDSWWDGKHFDQILLDAPCSASGVIRRHPDIKLRLKPDDIKPLQQQQRQLLESLWQTLQPGGLLVYVTCSVFEAENQVIIRGFCETTADAKVRQLATLPIGRATTPGWQILPCDLIPLNTDNNTVTSNGDGLYFACLEKVC